MGIVVVLVVIVLSREWSLSRFIDGLRSFLSFTFGACRIKKIIFFDDQLLITVIEFQVKISRDLIVSRRGRLELVVHWFCDFVHSSAEILM
jgi:hypothetical protein